MVVLGHPVWWVFLKVTLLFAHVYYGVLWGDGSLLRQLVPNFEDSQPLSGELHRNGGLPEPYNLHVFRLLLRKRAEPVALETMCAFFSSELAREPGNVVWHNESFVGRSRCRHRNQTSSEPWGFNERPVDSNGNYVFWCSELPSPAFCMVYLMNMDYCPLWALSLIHVLNDFAYWACYAWGAEFIFVFGNYTLCCVLFGHWASWMSPHADDKTKYFVIVYGTMLEIFQKGKRFGLRSSEISWQIQNCFFRESVFNRWTLFHGLMIFLVCATSYLYTHLVQHGWEGDAHSFLFCYMFSTVIVLCYSLFIIPIKCASAARNHCEIWMTMLRVQNKNKKSRVLMAKIFFSLDALAPYIIFIIELKNVFERKIFPYSTILYPTLVKVVVYCTLLYFKTVKYK